MLKRFIQLSVALSILPSGLPAFAGSPHRVNSRNAGPEKALQKTREEMNRLLGLPGVKVKTQAKAIPSFSLDPSITAAAEMEQCLVSVCGPARTNQSAMDTYMDRFLNPSLSAQRVWGDRFEGRLKDGLKNQKESAVRLIEIQKEELLKGAPVNERLPIRAFVGFMAAVLESSSRVGEFIAMSEARRDIVADEVKIEAYLRTLPENRREAIRLAITKFYIPMVQANFLALGGNPLSARLRSLYEGLPAGEALRKDARLLKRDLERARAETGPVLQELLMQNVSLEVLDRAETGADLSASDSETYLSTASSIEMMALVFDGGANHRVLMGFPIDFDGLRRSVLADGRLDQSLRSLQATNLDELSSKISAVCKRHLTASLDMGASELRVRRGQKMIRSVKEAAKTVARRFNEDPRLQRLTEDRIEGIEYSMPESSADKVRKLEKVLETQRKSFEVFAKSDWSSAEMRETFMMISLLSAMGSSMDGVDLSYEGSEMKKACEALPIGTLSDFSVTSLGRVSVSWFTLNYPEVGVGVVAHEVGHVVSHVLRSQRVLPGVKDAFTDSLSCVANRNPNQKISVRLSGFQDTPWSEEDWADHFATLVIKEMEKAGTLPATPKNMGCSLVADMGDTYSASQTVEPAKNDPHSSGLLRVLMIALDQGEMTPQCQKLVDRFPQKNAPLTCH